jgi:ATP-dependent helicase/nuclease subunit A
VEYAHDAIKLIVDSLESRIGQAMHRLLEWVSPLPGGVNLSAVEALWTNEQRVQVGRSFSLDPTQTHSAVTLALGILGGDATWAWNADQIAWSANEVPVTQRGRMLRIDRLVQRRVGGAWWVLDYKSSIHPENSPEMCAQLLGYRTAIAQAYAGQTVHAAFLTPQGALIEITSP